MLKSSNSAFDFCVFRGFSTCAVNPLPFFGTPVFGVHAPVSELYCGASPLHRGFAVFAAFDANSVSNFLCIAEEHKWYWGREISINKMWKGNSRGEKG